MPIHLPPMTRRELFKTSLATGACLLFMPEARADEAKRWALIADTHIGSNREMVSGGINMADHLKRVCAEIVRGPGTAGVLLDGDVALREGLPADYALVTELVEPVRKAEIPLHMTLGNHDHRENFWSAVKSTAPRALQSKHVSVIETPIANWFLLDSLDRTNVTPGRLGAEQLDWLAKALDARPNKPALVYGHHQPDFSTSVPVGGLIDTQALFDVLSPRRHVKAYIFGHTHHWELTQREGIHLVNLPPVAYVFQKQDPSGWLEAELKADGMSLTFHSLDPAHSAQGKKHELSWRSS